MVLTGLPKTATLKDGTEVTLRPLGEGDLDALCKFFSERVPEEDRHYLRYDVADRKVLARWIEDLPHTRIERVMIFKGDEIIANGAIEHHPHGWTRHIAEIRLVVARDIQGRGAGLLLLKELVAQAQAKHAELIKAQVYESHTTAMAVFQKLGFRMEAVLHGFAKDIDGNRQNLVVMVRDVEELWQAMEDMLWQSDWRGDS
jgi:RimJ/RimL family protein N-acetyltransferase